MQKWPLDHFVALARCVPSQTEWNARPGLERALPVILSSLITLLNVAEIGLSTSMANLMPAAGYFDAPGARNACLGAHLMSAPLQPPLPNVTLVFCAIEGLADVKVGKFRRFSLSSHGPEMPAIFQSWLNVLNLSAVAMGLDKLSCTIK